MAITVDNVVFPMALAYGTTGGPRYKTELEELESGFDSANSMWDFARHEFDAASAIVDQASLSALLKFFHARRGRSRGFLFTDNVDFTTAANGKDDPTKTDQELGIGDGSIANYQFIKVYSDAGNSVTRILTRPQSGTVLLAVDGVLKTEGTHFTMDYTLGIVTFGGSYIPVAGEVISGGCKFYVPVRFDTDFLETSLETYNRFRTATVPLIEVRE